jgi:ketosteroid isomerase-like protein
MRFSNRILIVMILSSGLSVHLFAGTEDEQVRDTFRKFVAAQNAHDLQAVEQILLDSPEFLWITRGTPIWGRAQAIARFRDIYAGTWQLAPDTSALRLIHVREGVVQVFVPVQFTIGPAGQPPQVSQFLINQVLVKTDAGWRISSILPILVPPSAR